MVWLAVPKRNEALFSGDWPTKLASVNTMHCSEIILTGCADRNIGYCIQLWELNPIGLFMVSLAYEDERVAGLQQGLGGAGKELCERAFNTFPTFVSCDE